MRKRSILSVLALVVAAQAHAYDAINRWMLFTGAYTFDGDKVYSGMNTGSNAVNAIAQDAQGNIWMGVSGTGLRMWDGKKLSALKAPKESYVNSGEILSLAADSKGVIWVGTSEGLVRYDGAAWTNLAPEETGLAAVREIVVTPTDKVYLSGFTSDGTAFTGGGISFYNGTGWSKFNASNTTIPDTLLQNLTLDDNNHLWMTVGAHDMGLAKFDGKNWKFYNTSNGLPTNNIRAIARSSKGLFFATPNSILRFDGTNWNASPYTKGFGSKMMEEMSRTRGEMDVVSLTAEDNGALWIGVRNGGLYHVKPDAARFYDASNSVLPGNTVMQVLVDKSGSKWFVTGDQNYAWRKSYFEKYHPTYTSGNAGVAVLHEYGRLTDPKWVIYDDFNSADGAGIPADLEKDASGKIRFVSMKGLFAIEDGRFQPLATQGLSMAGQGYNHLYTAPDGRIYVTDYFALGVYENGAVTKFAKMPNMGGIADMSYDAGGHLWSVGSGGLSMRNGEEWETYNKRKGDLPSIIIYSIFRDSKNRLWAGTAKGLIRYEDSAFRVYKKDEVEFPSDDIRSIAEDKQGRIWFGTNKGLTIYDGTTWTHVQKIESPKINKPTITDIAFDGNGVAWLATETDGLLRYDGTTWTQYNQKNTGTLFDNIFAVEAGDDGRIYVSSGLSEFQLSQSDFMMPNATGDEAIRQGIAAKIKTGDPKKVFAIIQP